MSDAVEVKKLVKQLESATAASNIQVRLLLRTLQKDFKVNEAIIRVTKASLAVGKLRTHASKEVSDLAKEVVKQWKAEVDQPKQGVAKLAVAVNTAGACGYAPQLDLKLITRAARKVSDVRTLKSDGVYPEIMHDSKREEYIELVYNALASDSGAPGHLNLDKAKAIEAAVFRDMDSTMIPAYSQTMDSLVDTLIDKNNPSLREAVGSGDLAVDKFVKMCSQTMASEERKNDSLGAKQQIETSAFQCPKCKQRKCTSVQLMTKTRRSTKEPVSVRPSSMENSPSLSLTSTLFKFDQIFVTFAPSSLFWYHLLTYLLLVSCLNCNNKWKYS
ncbi:hypothetical protein DFH06DRAFT_1036298 [Mycena polygramma]|nr:hypothetical protein DFH06DRAFT_1036298 [Mycena polygramma]